MVRNHLKRFAAPGFWKIAVKRRMFIQRPSPGPHALSRCIPLKVAICDTLGIVGTAREASYVLHEGSVRVDGRVVRAKDFPVGPMDVLSIPKLGRHYRLVTTRKGLEFVPIGEGEAAKKLVRISGKSTIKGGRVQLQLHDGRTLLVEDGSAYHVGDSLVLGVPEQKVLEHIPLKEGNLIMVTRGSHVGQVVKFLGVRRQFMNPSVAMLAGKDRFETLLTYVMPVGVEEPAVSLGG